MAERPRILHLHGTFTPGGKEARVVRLMNHWGRRARHSVLVGNPGSDSARAGLAADLHVDFPSDAPSLLGKPDLRRYWALARYMQRFDLVLSYNWGSMDGAGAHRLFSPIMRLPRLIHHEDGFNADEAAGLKPVRNRWREFMLPTAYAVVVPSMVLEKIARGQWRVPERKLHRIVNGIDVERYADRAAIQSLPGFAATPGKLVVGTVAGLRPVKNLRRLVRAVAPLRDRLQLVIAGEGEERDAILAEAAVNGLTDLYLAGHQPDPWRYLHLFEIFALSSDSEQFPISLLEAMAAGLPIASTDVGDVGAMVAAENRPLVVPDEAGLAEALATLAGDAQLRASLGAANQARARAEYDEATMLRRYSALYGEAMARPDILM